MLDNSSRSIKLGSWDFNVIQLEDMEMYASYIRQTKCPVNLWSSNFAYMWAISQSKKRTLLWKIIDGLLVTFVFSHKNTLYLSCLPFGNADPDKLIDVLLTSMRFCLEWNKQDKAKSSVKTINDNQLSFLKKSPRFEKYFTKTTWVGIERHFDVNKLSATKGKDFENVRGRLNKFYKTNPDAKIFMYQDSDYDSLIELDNQWRNTSGQKYSNIFDGVYYKELVKHGKELNQTTIVMKKDGRIIGMVSGGILPTNQSWGSVVKFENDYPGLSETLIVEYSRLIHKMNPDTEFLNVGSDLGPGGLRNYKLKFRPVLNFKRYQLFLK